MWGRGLDVKANCLRIIKNLTELSQFIYDKRGSVICYKDCRLFYVKENSSVFAVLREIKTRAKMSE